jgi:hypothetical protein
METTTIPATPVSVGIRYGVLLAATSVLVDFLIRIAGFSFLTYGITAFTAGIAVAIVWLIVAHSAFKKMNGGLMSFSQGLTIAVIMLFISAVFASMFNFIYINYIDNEFVANLKSGMAEFMERNNIPDDQIAKSTAKFDEMNVGIGMSLLNGVKNGIIGGLLLGAIISAFTKRNQPEFE